MKRIVFFRKEVFILVSILIIAVILRLYRLNTFLPWSEDIERDFLVAKEVITDGKFPLLGPPTSLNWLRLGPLVYYIWAVALYIGGQNPLSVGFTTVLFDLGAIILVFIFSRDIFGRKEAYYASMLYATSPFAVLHSRTPIHVSLVPFFSLLFYIFLWRFIRTKKTNYFYFCSFLLGMLIQLHITSIILSLILLIFLYRKISIRQLFFGIFLFLLPLTLFLIADAQNNFFISSRFIVWLPYRVFSAFGIFTRKNILTFGRIGNVFEITILVLQKMIFIVSKEIALLIFILGFIRLFFLSRVKTGFPEKKTVGERLIMQVLAFSYVFIFLQGQPVEHYFSFLLPIVIVNVAFLLSTNRLGWLVMLILVASNCYSLLNNNYY